jgi:predicted nucleic acid-binding protein
MRRDDPDHERMRTARDEDPGPYVVPAGILAEVAYLVESRLQVAVLTRFLSDLEAGAYTLDCGERDFARIRELVERYGDLSLGFADASVVACAERHGGRVLTMDRREFEVVARGERSITVLPQ